MRRKQTKVSMQDVADAVGVSLSTVSFVLNGQEKKFRISADISKQVWEMAKKMNYQVNEIARSLRTGLTRTVALIVADISDQFYSGLAFHFQEYAESKGYTVIVINTGEKQERVNSVFNILKNRKVDGILMVPIANIAEGVIERLNPDIPMVFVDRYFDKMETSRVIINNYEISKMVTQLLIGKGCKRIALITYRDSLQHMQDRKKGYTDVLSKNGLLDDKMICEVGYTDYKNTISDFLKRIWNLPTPVDGLFITTGGLSSVVIRCLVKMGVKLQSDIQIIGFDRMDMAVNVSIPYVRQPVKEICENAFDLLMSRIDSGNNAGNPVESAIPASIVTDADWP
ncbi:MAG: LacI family transcriptional regulator [Tannerella sp.]|jgi:LacI family transcriptional regulator|nr:LacI family transcriptional regulator [Tannerella sp.]